MNEVMFVTGGELLQFLPISSKKMSRYEYLFLRAFKGGKYNGVRLVFIDKKPRSREKQDRGYLKL